MFYMFADICKLLQHSPLQIFYVLQHVNLSFYGYLTFGVVGERVRMRMKWMNVCLC